MSEAVIPGGISCREVVELVTAYLDGALAPDEQARMESHLAGCRHCTAYVEQIRVTTRVVAAATAELELRPDRDALLRAFRDFRSAR
jgi:anti-sigma factor RsiW